MARLHAASSATSALSAAAAAAAAAQSPGRGLAEGGGGQSDGLVGIGCCLEYDALLGVVLISSVRPGGPAALSGKVAVGDVIVKVDGTPVACLQDAADLLVGPAGSLVLLSLLWRGRTATVALVRQHTLVLPAREAAAPVSSGHVGAGGGSEPEAVSGREGTEAGGSEGAGRDGEGGYCGVDIGAEVDFVKGVPTLLSLNAGGAAASSQGLQEGDEILEIDGEDPVALPHGTGTLDVLRLRAALKGPPWSRVMLKVARGVRSSLPPPGNGSGAGGGGGRAACGAGESAGGCQEVEVAVVRAPDVTGDEALFAAKVAYQAALVEAQQRSWLDGPRPGSRGPGSASPSSRLLQSVDWLPDLSLDERGAEMESRGAKGAGAFSVRGGVLGAAVMGLGEDIGGSANGIVSRVHDTISGQVFEVTSNVKENVAKSVDNVKHVSEAVVEGVAPILESRWQVLQLGSRVTGLVRSAVASVQGEGATLRRDSSGRVTVVAPDGTAGGAEKGQRGRDGMVEAAEGRVTVPGGVLDEVVVAFSATCVETMVVNGTEYGAALLGECSQSSGLLSKVRAVQKRLHQIHIWKEGSGRDARVRFMRLLFSDGSDLEAGARGSGGVYKGLVLEGAPFRLKFSSLRVLDVDVAPGTKAHKLSHSAALNNRPPASDLAYLPTGLPARKRSGAQPAGVQPSTAQDRHAESSAPDSHSLHHTPAAAVQHGSDAVTASSQSGQSVSGEACVGQAILPHAPLMQAGGEVAVDPFLGSFQGLNIAGAGGRVEDRGPKGRQEKHGTGQRTDGDIPLEDKWTKFIKKEFSSGERDGAGVKEYGSATVGSREKADVGAAASRR